MTKMQKMASVISATLMFSQILLCTHCALRAQTQPKLEARKAPIINQDGLQFKDLNKNGVLDRYEDWRLPIDKRIDDLLSKMTLEEKAGLMVHASIQGFTGPNGIVLDAPAKAPPNVPGAERNQPTPVELIKGRSVRWILIRSGDPADISARFSNNLQEIAEDTRLGIPVVLSSDPRNSPARPRSTRSSGTCFFSVARTTGLWRYRRPRNCRAVRAGCSGRIQSNRPSRRAFAAG